MTTNRISMLRHRIMSKLIAARLQARLLMLIAFAFAPVAALLIYNAAEQRRHDTAEVQESAERLARNSALRQNALFEEVHQFLETLAQLQVVRDPAQHGNCSQVFARLISIHPRYVNFGAALPNGDIICSAVPFKSRVNIADRAFFKRAFATREFAMSGIQTGRITGKLTIVFGHPATNARDKVEAIVFAALDLTWLNAMLAATQLPEGGALTVVNSEGTITARHPEPEQWVGKTLPDAPLVRVLLDQHGEGSVLAPGLDGVRRLYAFTTLSEKHAPGHYVTVGIPESEAFGSANRNMIRSLSFMVVIGLVVAVLAWFGSNRLVLRPIQALTAAMRRIGQGDLAARTGLPHTAEEFGQLARGFDTMAKSFEERAQRLRESDEHLHSVIDNVPALIAYVDAQQHYVYVNRDYRQRFAPEHADIQGRTVREILGDERYAIAAPRIDKALQGLAQDYDWQPFPDVWQRVNYVPQRDTSSRVTGYYVLISDITERKRTEAALELERSKLSAAFESVDIGLVICDAQGGDISMNAAALKFHGFTSVEDMGRRVTDYANEWELRYPDGRIMPFEEWPLPRALRGDYVRDYNCELRNLKTGHAWTCSYTCAPARDSTGQVVLIVFTLLDITERKRAEDKIHKLNAELEQRVHDLASVNRTLKTLSAGNRAMLHATDEQGLLDNMCRAIVDAGGYHMAMVFYQNDDELKTLSPMTETGYPGGLAALRMLKTTWADDEHGRGAVATAIRSGQPSVARNMLTDPNYAPWRQNLHGSASGVACPLRVDGAVIGALVVYASEPEAFGPEEAKLLSESADDLAFGIATLRARVEQEKTREAMHRLTRYDALTGLPNETQFTESLTSAIDSGERLNQPFALLQINIERLREINDALGFSHGDQLLREFGARLQAAAPEPAVVARLRGDEFAILLPDCNATAATTMVRRLEEVLARPFLIADIPLNVSWSIGIALFPGHGSTPHDLFRHMDMALQQARKKGVGHFIFDPAQNHARPSRLAMAGELRRAIEDGDLLLYLQPKLEIANGRVCGAEGLVRWKHAERGLIPPGEFIGLAEHTGLIKPLTEWVIEAALRLNHAWQREGCALPIAVNLSARNLREEDLLEKIRRLQATWRVGAGLLELEITESAVMEDAEHALRVLHALSDAGIPLYIDDFGTGYSSLSYLQKLPVDYIKIDQSFVRDMSTSKDSLTIVRSTIDLAHDLGLKVVAEGVETREDWDLLAALGCGHAQGYFIAKPMPAGELQNWIKQFRPPVATPPGNT